MNHISPQNVQSGSTNDRSQTTTPCLTPCVPKHESIAKDTRHRDIFWHNNEWHTYLSSGTPDTWSTNPKSYSYNHFGSPTTGFLNVEIHHLPGLTSWATLGVPDRAGKPICRTFRHRESVAWQRFVDFWGCFFFVLFFGAIFYHIFMGRPHICIYIYIIYFFGGMAWIYSWGVKSSGCCFLPASCWQKSWMFFFSERIPWNWCNFMIP